VAWALAGELGEAVERVVIGVVDGDGTGTEQQVWREAAGRRIAQLDVAAIEVQPRLEPLRTDPRFRALLTKVRLE
jgi:hypothetical protein